MGSTHSSVRYLPIQGFPGYEVGEDGSVWSCWTKKGRGFGRGKVRLGDLWKKLKPTPLKSGHLTVSLCKGGVRCTKSVHRLVLEAFVGPCPKGMECCHNDGNPANNHIENLRWDTHRNNHSDKIKHGTHLIGAKHGMAKLIENDVINIRRLSQEGLTDLEIAKRYELHISTVRYIRIRKLWKHI